ncbi:hypothetical protein H5410_045981, partial [Solanum commersonii]
MFIATRTKMGKQIQADTQVAITELQNRQNSGETVDDAFRAVFGKEQPGRLSCGSSRQSLLGSDIIVGNEFESQEWSGQDPKVQFYRQFSVKVHTFFVKAAHWKSGNLESGIWNLKSKIWKSENLEIWKSGNLEIWKFGIWKFGNLESGNLEIWNLEIHQ